MIKLIKSSFPHESETKQRLTDFIQRALVFSMGEQVKQFETQFAQKQQRKYAVMVNSGSSANLVLIQALLNIGKLKKGDRVGFSALTWATNIMPIIQLGLTPVALDCELDTLNVSPEILAQSINNLDGLFLTNVLGFSDDIQRVKELCADHNVLFIEDNCESLGSKVDGTLLGNFGLASTFSLYVGHHLSAIEGGMVCTDDEELYSMLLMVRAHGWDRNLPKHLLTKLRQENQVKDDFYAKYTFYDLAYNVRPTEIQGFLGTVILPYWDEVVQKRAEHFSTLHTAVQKNDTLYSFKLDHMDTVSNFAMPIICKTSESYEKYRRIFEEQAVEIRPVIAGDMTEQPFYKKYVAKDQVCSQARLIHHQGFYFGNNPELTESEMQLLVSLLQ